MRVKKSALLVAKELDRVILKPLDKIIGKINVELVNRYTSYFLVVFLWAPHGAKECIQGVCNGPNFVAPMLFTFLAPNWLMNMTWSGWGMQLLFSPPLILLMYLIFKLRGAKFGGKIFELYAVRWGLMYGGVLVYFNYVFWYGPLRAEVFPMFVF